MRLARQQFRRALIDALGVLTAQEARVVEEELRQVQVVWPQVPPQEEVVAQAAVEILAHGTGPDGAPGHRGYGLTQFVEAPAPLLSQGRLARPAARVAHVERLDVQHGA